MSVSSSHPRPRRRIHVFGQVLLTAALGLCACDEEIVVQNAAPTIQVEGWCVDGPRTYLVVTASDLESDPVDLSICAVGGPAMATGPTGDGLLGLTSAPGGRLHLIEWATSEGDCACPRDPETPGTCLSPPTGAAAPTVELLVADLANPIRPQNEQRVDPLDACR